MDQCLRCQVAVCLILMMLSARLFGPSATALASGPGEGNTQIRINNETVGPYSLLVATGPHPLVVGPLNVWVRVSDAGSNTIRSDAIVTVKAVSQAGGALLTAPATHENAGNDFNYLAHLPIETAGEWDISVYVEDEPGVVDLSFSETVTGDSNLMTLTALTLPFVALLLGVGFFLWRRSARPAAG